jgi:nucleoside 2-deoxyribosyltransferase
MPKAYITGQYTEKSFTKDKFHIYGKIEDTSFKNFLESIESVVKEFGFSTYLVHRDLHKWGEIYIEPEEVMKNVLEIMKKCDLVVACPEYGKGPNVEIGMAAALQKKIIIIVNENERTSLVHAGLNGISPTRIIKFKDIMDMKNKLRQTLTEFVKL